MKRKLTLTIDEKKVKKIKRFSKLKGKSVSKIIEELIDDVLDKEPMENLAIEKIRGAFGKIPKGFDADRMKWEYLKEKHGLTI